MVAISKTTTRTAKTNVVLRCFRYGDLHASELPGGQVRSRGGFTAGLGTRRPLSTADRLSMAASHRSVAATGGSSANFAIG
jgi:hypothetical protein